MQAKTIDDVIRQLDSIVDWARREKSRLGYFAALYRKVTLKVKEGMADGFFEDGERMERLDVIFANRYLDAFERYRNKRVLTRSWRVAFNAAKRWWPIVLQHLLLGMNAHINVDLGIAAARTSPGNAVHGLKNDFNKINEVLALQVDGVERELAQVWPVLGLLDRVAGRTEEALIHFSMKKARDNAWSVAEALAPLEERDQMWRIDDLDKDVAKLGRKVWKPGLVIGSVTRTIRLGEQGKIPQIIDILK